MDRTVLLSLAGVALGWLLNQLTSVVKWRTSTRAQVGRVLASLITYRDEIQRVRLVQERVKDTDGIGPAYEAYRLRSTASLMNADVDWDKEFPEMVKVVAGIAPLDAMALVKLKGIADRVRKADLTAASGSRQAYVTSLSIMETGWQLSERGLDKIILRLARMHGWITWFRVRRQIRGTAASIEKHRPIVNELLDQIELDSRSDSSAAAVKPPRGAD
jgi:hypothetical protein